VLLRAAIIAQYIITVGGEETVKVEGREEAGGERRMLLW
jgi:hypothetical protein